MKILLIKPSSFGDVLHALPVVELLYRAIPDLILDWVVNDNLADAARLCPHVRRLILFPRANFWRPSVMCRFFSQLRQERYDAVVDLQGLFRSGIFSLCAKSPRRIGFVAAREGAPFFYTEKYSVASQLHAVEKNLLLVRQAFGIQEPLPNEIPLHIPEECRKHADDLLCGIPAEAPLIGVCFSSRWLSKNWSLSYFQEIALQVLQQYPACHFLLLGGKDNVDEGEHLASEIPGALNLAGKSTLLQLAALTSRLSAMLTVDSGPMHLAAVLGIPCVALFGATSPTLTGPWSASNIHHIVHTCCTEEPCFKRVCPKGCNCADGVPVSAAVEPLCNILSTKIK